LGFKAFERSCGVVWLLVCLVVWLLGCWVVWGLRAAFCSFAAVEEVLLQNFPQTRDQGSKNLQVIAAPCSKFSSKPLSTTAFRTWLVRCFVLLFALLPTWVYYRKHSFSRYIPLACWPIDASKKQKISPF
jgi:hypothetical protein